MIKLLALAMFLPISTGFNNAAPDSGAAVAPEAIDAPAVKSPPPATPQVVETRPKPSSTGGVTTNDDRC